MALSKEEHKELKQRRKEEKRDADYANLQQAREKYRAKLEKEDRKRAIRILEARVKRDTDSLGDIRDRISDLARANHLEFSRDIPSGRDHERIQLCAQRHKEIIFLRSQARELNLDVALNCERISAFRSGSTCDVSPEYIIADHLERGGKSAVMPFIRAARHLASFV